MIDVIEEGLNNGIQSFLLAASSLDLLDAFDFFSEEGSNDSGFDASGT